MFESLDYATVPGGEAVLQTLLDPVRDAGVLSVDEWDQVRAEVDDLMRLIARDFTDPEQFWAAFRTQFGFSTSSITPMNAANLCPEPVGLVRAANLLRLFYNSNVAAQTRIVRGEQRGVRVRQLEAARALIAVGLGLPASRASDIALVRNASEANNAVSRGYGAWNKDGKDNVVLWSENHPTNLAAWQLRSEGGGLFQVRTVSFDYSLSDEEIASAFTRQIDDRTRFASYSAISNGSGFRIPDRVIAAIWSHATGSGRTCHVHMDGTMVWGARQVNLGTNPFCHSFVSSAHKWFLGPKETGVLYMDPSRIESFTPSIFAYDYKIEIHDWRDLPKSALRFELIGQRDDVNLIILALTQAMWNALATAGRKPYERVQALGGSLLKKLTDRRWEAVTPLEEDRRWGVIRVKAPQAARKKPLDQWLYEDWGNKIAGSGDAATFRLCPHIYNTMADIDNAVLGMNTWREQRSA